MQNNSTIWMPVAGYEGLYEVSSTGFVRSVTRSVKHSRGGVRVAHGRALSPCANNKGYMVVVLSRYGVTKTRYVHRLLMLSFFPNNNSESMDINHKDGNPKNNHIENLEWCTRSENNKHSYRNLGRECPFTGKTGALNHKSKPVIGVHRLTGESFYFPAAKEAARVLGISNVHISSCARGERRSHKGYEWRYV